jgi:hypothetical protein
LRNRVLLITSLLTLATLASAQNFVAPRIYNLSPNYTKATAVGDFNGDGKPDLAFPYVGSPGQIEVLLSNGDGSFQPPLISGNAGSYPVVIAVGDFNGDGKLDVVVGEEGTKQGTAVTVLLGNGDGTFSTSHTYTAGSTDPLSVLVGDFNNDGNLDVVVLDSSTANVEIFLGNGDGTLQAGTSFTLGSSVTTLAAGDFNADGNLDLIVGNTKSGDMIVALGNGDGTFQQGISSYVVSVESFVVADLNHDGKLDLVLYGCCAGTISVALGNGNGTFQSPTSFAYGTAAPAGITLADLNHDGKLDLVISQNETDSGTIDSLEILLGNGDGTFQTAVGYSIGSGFLQTVVADFNGDGNPDIAGLTYETAIIVTLGNGDGTFICAPTYTSGSGMGISADFNNDGIPDLAIATNYASEASILLGVGDGTFRAGSASNGFEGEPGIAAGDFNGDGNMDLALANGDSSKGVIVQLGTGTGVFGAPTYYLTDSEPDFVATGDLNGDGKLDLVVANDKGGDISVLLGNGDGTFQSAVNYREGATPSGLVLADFNGDHILDVAVSNSGGKKGGSVGILLGNGDGTFAQVKGYAQTDSVQWITAGDLNGDGKLDLVYVGHNYVTDTSSVNVMLGNGDGTFQPPVAYPAPLGADLNSAVLADFNGDGKLDVAAGDYSYPGGVDVLLGNGDGTLQPAIVYAAAQFPAYVIAGDFNLDGATDLAAINEQQGTVSVLLNSGGTFITTTSSPNPSAVGQSVTFTATVKGSISTTPTPTGSVTFYEGSKALRPITLTSGSASFTTSTLGAGNHVITAVYSGDSHFNPHTGTPITQSVISGPLVVLNPSSLNFASQAVGTNSPTQTVTLTNTGVATLTITSITTTGDFSATNTCGNSVAAGSRCSIIVTFTPTTTGTRTGTVSIVDNAAGSPQTVSLTGTGIAPVVQLLPASLTFATELVGSSSPSQAVTLTNTGAATLSVSSISITEANVTDYLQSNNCGASVAVRASCTINVVFHPVARGPRSAVLSVSDDAAGSPQTVTLSGTGTVVSLSATAINFGSESVGKTSAPNTLTLTNTAQSTLTIGSITITGADPGDFAQTNTCGGAVAGGQSCSISVTFTPTKKGARSATVSIADSGGGSPQSVGLTGTGN